MDDLKVLNVIKTLVDEEQSLRSRGDGDLDEPERARMQELEVELDQCWDYLRQRRAARENGLTQRNAGVRPPDVVEGYQQ